MPIEYSVSDNGHFITPTAIGLVTPQEYIDYEMTHVFDKRVRASFSKLFVIESGAFQQIIGDKISHLIEQRRELSALPIQHSCAIVVTMSGFHAWDLAEFYEGMFSLHYPEVVIVFADAVTARIWLRVE